MTETQDRISYRNPDIVNIHVTPQVEEIYNSLLVYKKEARETESQKDVYTPDVLLKILEKKVTR
jgi:hypothetical protein